MPTTTGPKTATNGSPSTPTTSSSTASGLVTASFTYTASDKSGRVNNPFIAVWVEDASSHLVGVLGVVYFSRESKYLRELTSWASAATKVSSAQLDAVTGPTRSAGAYSLQWNGKGLDGSLLRGAHTLWIEAAREHGPHSVTSGPISLGVAGKTTIPANGELSSAAVTLV